MIYKRKFDRKTFEKYNKVLKNQESERFDESFGTETRKGHWNGSLSLEMAIELGKKSFDDRRLSSLLFNVKYTRISAGVSLEGLVVSSKVLFPIVLQCSFTDDDEMLIN